MTNKLVLDLKPASASRVRAIDRHEIERETDGTSAIDPTRLHLNQTLHGLEDGPNASLAAFYEGGVNKPAKQAEAPYLSAVISASPSYFRPSDPEARGRWNDDRMTAWRDRSMAWLRAEFGNDLVHASLHLDEDTPHIHALIAPTYEKKRRVPGRRKRNETEDEFEARKREAQNAPGVRTVGRSSHAELSQRGSYTRLRESLVAAVADIGIEYGDDRQLGAPRSLSTREWVAQETVKLKSDREALAAKAADLAEERRNFRARAKSEVAKIRDAQQKIAHDKRENTEIFKELKTFSADLKKKEAALNTVLKRVVGVARSIAGIIGLPLPSTLSTALKELEAGVEEYRLRNTASADADSAPPEDPRDETGPSF